MIFFSMMRRRPRIRSSNIKRQTHDFAESTFVIFENLRARKMLHDFLIRGSGRTSFFHYTLRSGTFTHLCGSHHCAHSKMRPPLSDRCPREIAGRRRRRPESAVADQATASCPLCADAGKAPGGVLKFYGARDKARRFASVLVAYLVLF